MYPNRIFGEIFHGISWRESFLLLLGDYLHLFCLWVVAEFFCFQSCIDTESFKLKEALLWSTDTFIIIIIFLSISTSCLDCVAELFSETSPHSTGLVLKPCQDPWKLWWGGPPQVQPSPTCMPHLTPRSSWTSCNQYHFNLFCSDLKTF